MAEEDDIATPTSTEDGKINFSKVYNDFIKVIDAYRSNVNITDPNNKSLLKKINEENFNAGGGQGIVVESNPQESRCHAFFRLLGFPVVSDNGFYNPGLDVIKNPNQKRKVDLEKKISVANNQIESFKDFSKISDARESYVNSLLPIFSNNNSMDATVLAISAANIRPISSVFAKNSDSIENPFDPENQSYEILDTGQVGKKIIKLNEFVNSIGEKPTKFAKKRNHIIKPFIVDARIDITTPNNKKIGVPFVENLTQLKINETSYTKRPLIEKIIIDRFSDQIDAADQNTQLDSIKVFINFVKSSPFIKDANLVKTISSSSNTLKLSEAKQLQKYFNLILVMSRSLVEFQRTIQSAQALYYWIPIPSTTGIEAGISVRPIILTELENFYTISDLQIVVQNIKYFIDQLNSQAEGLTGNVPKGAEYAIPSFTNTFSSETSDIVDSTIADQLSYLFDLRAKKLGEANKALQNIEIIMGEFTGLGLSDIVIIMASLYTMDRDSLLGFLDDDAYDRAAKVLSIPKSRDESKSSITKALKNLTDTVKNYYNLFEQAYTYILNEDSDREV